MARGWRRRVQALAAAQAVPQVGATGQLTNRATSEVSNTAWHVPPLPTKHPPCLSIIFGTYNRLRQLQRCVTESRKSRGDLPYEFVICDGGSTDGSREWLVAQQDVIFLGDRTLDGAVTAYNRAFLCTRGNYLALLNDDCVPLESVLAEAVAMLEAAPNIGQVAIPFDRQGRTTLAHQRGQPVASYSVLLTETARAVAAVCGGLWNPLYHTYGGDWELSCLIHERGWRVAAFPRGGVLDFGHEPRHDALRTANQGGQRREAD